MTLEDESKTIPVYCQNFDKISAVNKGPVELIKRVKIAHSFLQSVSDQFHPIVLSLPM